MPLLEFLIAHRDEVLQDARRFMGDQRPSSPGVRAARDENVPAFLDAVIQGLIRRESLPKDPVPEPERSGAQRPHSRWKQYDVDEVVHEYGVLCLTILRTAERHGEAITNEEHQLLNQALDENIAADVIQYEQLQREETRQRSAERLGFVAHELRNALHTAALSFQAIRSGHVPAKGITGGVVERSHHRLRELVERLLTQVRLGSGAAIRRDRLLVAALVEEAVGFMGEDARAKGIHLEVHVDDSCAVSGDVTLLTSALTNLLQNAVKFTPEGGTVTMRSNAAEGGCVRIEVEDECGGFDPALKDRAFAPFVQGPNEQSGLGLGLSIARDIVVAHGGTLHLSDVPGHGCIFTIELPAAEQMPSGNSRG
jgi:signal transduction histidine kinase